MKYRILKICIKVIKYSFPHYPLLIYHLLYIDIQYIYISYF